MATMAGERKGRRRELRELIVAARMIFESGMTDARSAGQILYRFLDLEARREPIGLALAGSFGAHAAPAAPTPKATPAPPPLPEQSKSAESAKLWGDKPDAKGADTRGLGRIIDDEVASLNEEVARLWRKNDLEPVEALNPHQAINHLVTDYSADSGEVRPFLKGNGARRDPGECLAILIRAYAGVWRDWLRHNFRDYLDRKYREAELEVERQVYGDAPISPEDDTQEPAHRAEDEAHEEPADRGEAWEPPAE